jgi:hypothetical protein
MGIFKFPPLIKLWHGIVHYAVQKSAPPTPIQITGFGMFWQLS